MRSNNKILFNKAKRYLVGGVDSPVRAFGYVGGDPVLIKSGRGSKIYDYDGNAYIDYVLSWGASILGHARADISAGLIKRIGSGLNFGTTNEPEVKLAEIIHQAVPFVKKIRFVNSGTEAVMSAVRLARGFTKRDLILKFKNSYHGSADFLLLKAGSGLATLKIATSAGVPDNFLKDTLVVPYGDIELVKDVFKKYAGQIAAVIIEPVGGNHGVIPLNRGFLLGLGKITRDAGSLLIFDEVITGFRFGFGTVASKIGIKPDLVCLGKIIGGGLPIGAYGGSRKIMNHLAPLGKVYQASTFSGNPIVMQAGLDTLKALKKLKNGYARLDKLAEHLALGLRRIAQIKKVKLTVEYCGSMFSIKFNEKKQFQKFYRNMLDQGVYFAPSEFEADFLSFAHTTKDIENTLAAAEKAFDKI
ncbi:MAG: glutamate-1-semialdehyde 2,1-aminomutase [Candidatus Omnitrophota bacterium]|nr:glutamate-1-semialdehyde 2,1-aminomutase [Candidatus Omnitrophota bacterium]